MLKVFNELKPNDVADYLGISPRELAYSLKNKSWPNLKYEIIQGAEREALMLSILKTIDEEKLRVVGENNNDVWEKGWGEMLSIVKNSKTFSVDLLAPQYFEKHKILRFRGEYIRTDTTEFIYHYDQIIRRAIFTKYLSDQKRIVEIGCGTGNSQIVLSEICQYEEVELVAADWATPSQELLGHIKQQLNINLTPVNFNMLTLEGGQQLNIDSETAVLTVHALEQLGSNFKPLLDYLLQCSPSLCVHIEPIKEFYEEDNLFDYLAFRYHEKRNYLNNWLTELRQLAQIGRIEIIAEQRCGFGDRYHEAYNLVVWKPYKNGK